MSENSLLDCALGRFELARQLLTYKVFLSNAELRRLASGSPVRAALVREYRAMLETVATVLYGNPVDTWLPRTMIVGDELAVCTDPVTRITLSVAANNVNGLVVSHCNGLDFTNDRHVALHLLSTNTAKPGGWWDVVQLPVLARAVARLSLMGLTDDDLLRLGLVEYGYTAQQILAIMDDGFPHLPQARDPLVEV